MYPEIKIVKTYETGEPDAFWEPHFKVSFGAEEKIFKTADAARKWLYEKCDMHVKNATAQPSAPKQYKRKLLT